MGYGIFIGPPFVLFLSHKLGVIFNGGVKKRARMLTRVPILGEMLNPSTSRERIISWYREKG
jgi:hypothetical protein